jgi:surfeit locus 1 family protein
MNTHAYTKPTLVAWLFFIVGLGTTLALGTWQLQRLAWKTALIDTIQQAQLQPPHDGLPSDPAAIRALEFYYVQLDGAWLPSHEFTIAVRYFKGQLGYHVVTPFQLADGRVVMVNRGWVPSDLKEPETRPDSAVAGEATITGMLRYGPDRNAFTPVSQPEKNMWFARDVAEMATHSAIADVVANVTVDVVGEQDPRLLPVPFDGRIALRNDHLSYVITWYGIALGILVIFVVYHRKKVA